MNTQSSVSTPQQKAGHWVLTVPVQASLYFSLCGLIVWTLYFSTYPAVHDAMHPVRHHTLLVGCH